MLPIKRFPGSAPGRSSIVAHAGLVYTVVTADTYELDMTRQTREALANLDRQLAEAGTDKSRLLQTTIYLADMARKPEMNAVWLEWVDHDNPPQRACVGAELEEGDLIEIIAIAASKE
ncbi:RidA family protein [Ferrovibrio sp.]|uniref:RidA family protein n=1 Tax=Ferrovibrio sp. TaxID=1917215 RepID=UPI0025BB784A|nr:RidA family protein [Ferrovibrio sp.]MBX3454540.1 RidA family protein [Ferrovibrio sp.]